MIGTVDDGRDVAQSAGHGKIRHGYMVPEKRICSPKRQGEVPKSRLKDR